MNIVACVKRVPLTDVAVKPAADGVSLDTTGFEYSLSFYDDLAVEAAIQTKEKLGGEVTVLTIGPAEASKELRECLAKGADKGLILEDSAGGARDPRSTAKALAAKIGELGAQVVFCGRVATDRDNAAVGPMLATHLGWACVTDVIALELSADKGTAKRETEAGVETLEFSLPAVITCDKGLNEPRYAGLKGIMAAKKKPIDQAPLAAEPAQAASTKLALPPARKEGRIVGEGAAAVPALIDALRNEAQAL
ncbi:MAG TPA: electron transfer flavoprotein subunit beta/FixA family protein [Planctomycetota bacterium]|nr:electron transfer flavoprotein subunit beta/FixA family protein [Planctomycetota bacterium]